MLVDSYPVEASPGPRVAEITLENLTKVYSDGAEAVTDLDLAVENGEFVVLVGPSGCGKTTALRMVAGLETITSSTTCRRRTGTSPWSSRTTRSIRT